MYVTTYTKNMKKKKTEWNNKINTWHPGIQNHAACKVESQPVNHVFASIY